MRKCYISRCYPGAYCGGFKGKMDMEKFLSLNGFINIGLPQKICKNKIYIFIYTFLSVLKAVLELKKGDILVLQYPLKKYYYFITSIARLKGAKVITLIHDLGCFRRKRLTLQKEYKRLSKTDYLIALSERMKEFMIDKGYKQGIGTLDVWDYYSNVYPCETKYYGSGPIKIVYVGGLKESVNGFIYNLDQQTTQKKLFFDIYGDYFNKGLLRHSDHFNYHGLTDSEEIIRTCSSHYGLLWYSQDINSIDGVLGEYLKFNTSHKISLYILANKPVIVWNQASFAEFTRDNNIGICISSLSELQEKLEQVTEKEYNEMVNNMAALSVKLRKGHYFLSSVYEGINYLEKLNKID